jgi:hypothetical protein
MVTAQVGFMTFLPLNAQSASFPTNSQHVKKQHYLVGISVMMHPFRNVIKTVRYSGQGTGIVLVKNVGGAT